MTSAKRRINSTGRKRIRREDVNIRMLDSAPGEPLRAKASINLDAHEFPSASIISLEAYHRSSGMRFDFGTVGAQTIPDVLVLDEVDRSGTVLFRIKVVEAEGDRGRILGSAERIPPTSEDAEQNRRSLFPVVYRSLDEEVWKVDIDYGGRPTLILNREIPGIGHRLKEDPFLQGFLFPAAFRIVMEAIARDQDEDDDDEPGWRTEWLQFCRDSLGIHDVPPASDAEEWIDHAVSRFCNEYGFMKRIRKMEEEAR
jgi:hypothetical protein